MLSLLVNLALAQSPEFQPVVQVRPRVEAHTGRDGSAQDGSTAFVVQRTRLGMRGGLEGLSTLLVVQDVRVWGEETHTLFDATANRLDLHEGWLRFRLGEASHLTVGRQELALHEHRLLGNVGWTAQARSFDAIRLSGGRTGLNGELALALVGNPNEAIPPAPVAATPPPYTELIVGRGGWMAEEKAALADLVYLGQISQSDDGDPTNDGSIHTLGAYLRGTRGAVGGRIEGYGQIGEMGATRQAWMVGISGKLAPDAAGKPSLELWYDHLSGDEDPGAGPDTAFDTLYDTRHKFYGWMDVMNFGVGGRADGRGLQDAALKLGMAPSEQVKLGLDSHLFLASAAQGGDALIGEEVDGMVKWAARPGLVLLAGGAVLARPSLDPDLWSYFQLDAKL